MHTLKKVILRNIKDYNLLRMGVLLFSVFYAMASPRDDSLGYVRRSYFPYCNGAQPNVQARSRRVSINSHNFALYRENNPIFTYFYYHTTPTLNNRLLCIQMAQFFIRTNSHIVLFYIRNRKYNTVCFLKYKYNSVNIKIWNVRGDYKNVEN